MRTGRALRHPSSPATPHPRGQQAPVRPAGVGGLRPAERRGCARAPREHAETPSGPAGGVSRERLPPAGCRPGPRTARQTRPAGVSPAPSSPPALRAGRPGRLHLAPPGSTRQRRGSRQHLATPGASAPRSPQGPTHLSAPSPQAGSLAPTAQRPPQTAQPLGGTAVLTGRSPQSPREAHGDSPDGGPAEALQATQPGQCGEGPRASGSGA